MKSVKQPLPHDAGDVFVRIEGLEQTTNDPQVFRLIGATARILDVSVALGAISDALQQCGWDTHEADAECDGIAERLQRKQLAKLLAERITLA